MIGGDGLSSRNFIGASSDIGVWIATFLGGGGSGNRVVNNVIGLDRVGAQALPNGIGVLVNGSDYEIVDNRIGGNNLDGTRIAGDSAFGNVVEDNGIGGGTGSLSLTAGNGRMGVMVENVTYGNTIGPGNIVGRKWRRRHPRDAGRTRTQSHRRQDHRAHRSARHRSGQQRRERQRSRLDALHVPERLRGQRRSEFLLVTEALRLQAGFFPVGKPVRVRGTLRSVVAGPYRIEIFGSDACEANGHGEAQRLLGSLFFTIENEAYCPDGGGFCLSCNDGNCTAGFSTFVAQTDAVPGNAITLTATSPGGSTSEFSECSTFLDENT